MNTKTIVIALLLLGVAITKADPALSVDTVDSAQLKCLLSISLQQTTKGRLLGKDIARGDRRSGGVTKIAAVSPFGASPDKIAREDKKSGGMVRIASSAPGTGGSKIVRGDKKSGGDVKIAYVSPRASGDKIVRGDKTNGGNIKIAALGVNRAIFIINDKAKKAQIILASPGLGATKAKIVRTDRNKSVNIRLASTDAPQAFGAHAKKYKIKHDRGDKTPSPVIKLSSAQATPKVEKKTKLGKKIDNFLSYLPFLSKEIQDKVESCKLDLTKAFSRCEAENGVGKCEKTPTGAQRTCPEGTKKFGCCLCSVECPAGFEEKDYYCVKPEAKKSVTYATKDECENLAKSACESWVGAFWVPKCTQGFRRLGADQCIPLCPVGWTDSGRLCFKPKSTSLGAPFNWIPSDN